jgi:hypothetical protein
MEGRALERLDDVLVPRWCRPTYFLRSCLAVTSAQAVTRVAANLNRAIALDSTMCVATRCDKEGWGIMHLLLLLLLLAARDVAGATLSVDWSTPRNDSDSPLPVYPVSVYVSVGDTVVFGAPSDDSGAVESVGENQ